MSIDISKTGEPLGRPATTYDNSKVHSFLNSYCEEALRKKHPRVDSIISGTIEMQIPRKLRCSTLLEVLRGCPIITVHEAAEATGFRYARSTIAEYAMLARIASKSIEGYITASQA